VSETPRKKKLIEVALPLDEINAACKADKDRKTGTIRNLHKWFAPMPLPAWRALLFAALVDDPEDDNQRVYLLDVIKRLVANGADLPDESDVSEARALLARQYSDGVPAVLDPFCGGGSTLVEAQRLGLRTVGSDLNPVPVLITRTLTELLPSVWNHQPIHAEPSNGGTLFSDGQRVFTGYEGLSIDLLYYADRVRNAAEQELAKHYPHQAGERPIAWIWARTARCTNPACGIETVLTTSWWLSKQEGSLAWIEPSVVSGQVELKVVSGANAGGPPDAPKVGRGANFACVSCGNVVDEAAVMAQGKSDGLGLRMTAVAVEESGFRRYREPSAVEIAAAGVPAPIDLPDISLGPANQYVAPPRFGLTHFTDLYTPRQLLALTTFADRVAAIPDEILADGGTPELASAISTLLGLAVGKMAQYGSSQSRITPFPTSTTRFNGVFGRNDIPMTWDFFEQNFFGPVGGNWDQLVRTVVAGIHYAPNGDGRTLRNDARTTALDAPGLVATDPPYFDAIGYADLADYFYMWHRRTLRRVHPDLYQTIKSPRDGELTAFAWHHGGTKDAARDYFIGGFTDTFISLQKSMHPDLPMLIVYASKEQKGGGDEETRWSSILTAIVAADLEITGTWPVHGTGSTRMRGIGANAVATYIVMVCRPRPINAETTSLASFNRSLRRELAPAVRDLQASSILPVDLAQAAMGPGMEIFSRYRAVLDQSGAIVGVGQALRLINAALAEILDEQEGELDQESRFAVRWWESYGWTSAPFGDADKTARPLGISVDDVVRAEVATSQANKVQLLGSERLDRNWRPSKDAVPTAWEAVHHLADRLIDGGGELEAARLMGRLGPLQDSAMALAYRLHDIAAKKGRKSDQERYNALISSWAELIRLSGDAAEGLF
jgi:putative DNA methylase